LKKKRFGRVGGFRETKSTVHLRTQKKKRGAHLGEKHWERHGAFGVKPGMSHIRGGQGANMKGNEQVGQGRI